MQPRNCKLQYICRRDNAISYQAKLIIVHFAKNSFNGSKQMAGSVDYYDFNPTEQLGSVIKSIVYENGRLYSSKRCPRKAIRKLYICLCLLTFVLKIAAVSSTKNNLECVFLSSATRLMMN